VSIPWYQPTKGPVVPHQGATRSEPAQPQFAQPPPPFDVPGPRDGFIIAFGPIDGVTNRRALDKPFFFQVPPLNQFPADWTWQWNDFGTIGSGMHSNPNYAQLASYSFDSCFVLDDGFNKDLVILRDDASIFERIRLLRNLGDSLTPFAMQVGSAQVWGQWEPLGRKQQSQVAVTLRSFHVETRSGEPDTRYFTLQLTEFMDAGPLSKIVPPKTTTAMQPGSHQPRRDQITTSQGQRMHLLKPADLLPENRTLRALATAYYGDPTKWKLIAKASNLNNVGPDDDLRVALGSRTPPVKLRVPQNPQTGSK
jgi:hypothetical protein